MGSEAEIDRMVVRLEGDGTDYEDMLDDAVDATDDYTRAIDGRLRDAQGRFVSGMELVQAELAMASNAIEKATVLIKHMGLGMVTAGAQIGAMGNKMKGMGTTMSLAVTAPLVGMGALSLREFGQFDAAMTESTSIISATTEEVERMRSMALDLTSSGAALQGPETLAKSYFFLASAGKSVEQQMALLPKVSAFATAGAFDMELATSLLADTQSALGMSSQDAAEDMKNMTRVSDVLVQANILANASVQEFAEALTNTGAASLRAFNKDIEEGSALLSAYAEQGIKGNVAGTNLSRVMLMLSASSRENAEEHKKLGFSVFDSTGKMRNFADIVENLETITAGMSDELKSSTLDMLGFKAETQKAIVPLLGTSKAIRKYEAGLRQAGGLTKQVADKQMKSFTNQVAIMRNQLAVIGIEIGKELAPMLQILGGYLSTGIGYWRALSPEVRRVAVVAGIVVAALGPLLAILGTVTVGIGAVISAAGTLISTLAAIGAPALAAGAALVTLGAAVLGLANPWQDVTAAVKLFFTSAMGFIANFQENINITLEWLKTNWRAILTELGVIAGVVFENIGHNFEVITRMMMRLLGAFAGYMSHQFEQVFTVDFVMWLISGVDQAQKILGRFAIWGGKKLASIFTGGWGAETGTKFIASIREDFSKSLEQKDFFGNAADIIKEEAGNLKGALDGWEPGLAGPALNLKMGADEVPMPEAISLATAGTDASTQVLKDAGLFTEQTTGPRPPLSLPAMMAEAEAGLGAGPLGAPPVAQQAAGIAAMAATEAGGKFADENAIQKPLEAVEKAVGGKDQAEKTDYMKRIAVGIERLVTLTEKKAGGVVFEPVELSA